MFPFFHPSCKILNVWCALSREKEGAPFYHCSGLSRISLLINPGMDPDVPVTVFALKLVGELLLQSQCAYWTVHRLLFKVITQYTDVMIQSWATDSKTEAENLRIISFRFNLRVKLANMVVNERERSTGHLYEAPRRLQIFYNSRKRSPPLLTSYSHQGQTKHMCWR